MTPMIPCPVCGGMIMAYWEVFAHAECHVARQAVQAQVADIHRKYRDLQGMVRAVRYGINAVNWRTGKPFTQRRGT